MPIPRGSPVTNLQLVSRSERSTPVRSARSLMTGDPRPPVIPAPTELPARRLFPDPRLEGSLITAKPGIGTRGPRAGTTFETNT
jgi:hypothetical protein